MANLFRRKNIETASRPISIPLPIWYPPFGSEEADQSNLPLHAITQRPMAMYHSWGGQNAWLRQIHGENALYMSRETAHAQGIEDGDWVWVTSAHNRIKVPVRLMSGLNKNTVWTWNAIGKRRGAWNLSEDASEATKGFLLNHLIDDLLPANDDGYRYSNSDPLTGQAAWYDLRVRVEKAAPEEAGTIEPSFAPLKRPHGVGVRPDGLRYGAAFKVKS